MVMVMRSIYMVPYFCFQKTFKGAGSSNEVWDCRWSVIQKTYEFESRWLSHWTKYHQTTTVCHGMRMVEKLTKSRSRNHAYTIIDLAKLIHNGVHDNYNAQSYLIFTFEWQAPLNSNQQQQQQASLLIIQH